MNKDNNSNNNKQIMNRGSQNKMMMIIIIIIIIHSNLPLWQVYDRAGFTLTHVMSRENFSWVDSHCLPCSLGFGTLEFLSPMIIIIVRIIIRLFHI